VKTILMLPLTVAVFSLPFLTCGVVFASSGNWVEVTRFTGSGSDFSTTDYFTCDHVEWRIRWEYFPGPDFPSLALFSVNTYRQGEDVFSVDTLFQSGSENTTGISYVHNKEGTFYMDLSIANTESYTIIVEQDLNSIPEFPTWTITPLIMVAALIGIIYKMRLNKSKQSSKQLF